MTVLGAYIDVTVGLRHGIPVWPGSTGFSTNRVLQLQNGDPANVTRLEMDVHTATHVDAPNHFIAGGRGVESLLLDDLIGTAFVVDMRGRRSITAADLSAADIPSGTKRLLLLTDNSEHWTREAAPFDPDFVALTPDAADWVVQEGIRLIGIDYLSIQRYQNEPETHRTLLSADVVIVEGLNLSSVAPGSYELICLPILLPGSDGAPARVLLRSIRTGGSLDDA